MAIDGAGSESRVSSPGGTDGVSLRPFHPRSVQGKFLAYVVPIVLVSTVAVFALFEWNARQSAEEQLRVKLVTIQSAVIAESLWNVADEQIKLILTALITDPDVTGAAVLDELDTPVATVGDAAALETSSYAADADILYDTGDQVIRIGALKLALTDDRLAALGRERLVLAVVLAGILLSAVIGATLVANRRTIGKPLALLLESINSAKGEALGRAVAWSSRDEIGRVVSAFNDMQRRQEAYEAQLKAANSNGASRSGPRNSPERSRKPSLLATSLPTRSRASPRVSRCSTGTIGWSWPTGATGRSCSAAAPRRSRSARPTRRSPGSPCARDGSRVRPGTAKAGSSVRSRVIASPPSRSSRRSPASTGGRSATAAPTRVARWRCTRTSPRSSASPTSSSARRRPRRPPTRPRARSSPR